MVKPLSRIVGFGPLILGIRILVGEIKPHLHYCGSKQNTFVNEVKSTCFQTWVKILSGWNKNGSEKVSAGEYCHPAAPNIASHASPRRRFRDQLCHPCHLLFRARNLIGHLFGATNGWIPRREFRLQTIFSVHPCSPRIRSSPIYSNFEQQRYLVVEKNWEFEQHELLRMGGRSGGSFRIWSTRGQGLAIRSIRMRIYFTSNHVYFTFTNDIPMINRIWPTS